MAGCPISLEIRPDGSQASQESQERRKHNEEDDGLTISQSRACTKCGKVVLGQTSCSQRTALFLIVCVHVSRIVRRTIHLVHVTGQLAFCSCATSDWGQTPSSAWEQNVCVYLCCIVQHTICPTTSTPTHAHRNNEARSISKKIAHKECKILAAPSDHE
jgi:hypothetical protein